MRGLINLNICKTSVYISRQLNHYIKHLSKTYEVPAYENFNCWRNGWDNSINNIWYNLTLITSQNLVLPCNQQFLYHIMSLLDRLWLHKVDRFYLALDYMQLMIVCNISHLYAHHMFHFSWWFPGYISCCVECHNKRAYILYDDWWNFIMLWSCLISYYHCFGLSDQL